MRRLEQFAEVVEHKRKHGLGSSSFYPAATTMWDVGPNGWRRLGAVIATADKVISLEVYVTRECDDWPQCVRSDGEALDIMRWRLERYIQKKDALEVTSHVGEWCPVTFKPGRELYLFEQSEDLDAAVAVLRGAVADSWIGRAWRAITR